MTLNELMALMQERLEMSDRKFAAYLGCDVTTLRKTRAGVDDLPIHSKVRLLDHAGFLKVTSVLLSVLPQRAKEKLEQMSQNQAHVLAAEQQATINALQAELAAQGVTIDDDKEASVGDGPVSAGKTLRFRCARRH